MAPATHEHRVFQQPLSVIGHRGLGAGVINGLGENTAVSFQAAIAAGVHWVETDARRTADGGVVISHDPQSPGGQPVRQMTAAEASAQGLLRLEELFELIPADIGVDLEVKNCIEDASSDAHDTTAAVVAASLAGQHLRRPLLITSFDPAVLIHFRDRAPEVATGLLVRANSPLTEAVPAARHLGARVICPQVIGYGAEPLNAGPDGNSLTEVLALTAGAGVEVLAWCASGETTPPQVLDIGVDAVCVNDVEAVLRQAGSLRAHEWRPSSARPRVRS